MHAFHTKRGIRACLGRGRHEDSQDYLRWYFVDPTVAAVFGSRFWRHTAQALIEGVRPGWQSRFVPLINLVDNFASGIAEREEFPSLTLSSKTFDPTVLIHHRSFPERNKPTAG